MKNARDYLIDILDDFRNNYLTLEKFAEHNGLKDFEACKLLDLARQVVSHPHPEA